MNMKSSLRYLVFDLLDADDTSHTWEAMASVHPARLPAVLGEAIGLVAWAQAEFGAEPLALDDGGEWDAWLQVQADQAPPLTLNWPTHGDPTLPSPSHLAPSGWRSR
jgi:hypothetical protein